MLSKIIKKFSIFEWSMILAVIGFTTYFAITNKEDSLIYILIDALAAIYCDCPYINQLVYTSDNKLTAGFGKKVLCK